MSADNWDICPRCLKKAKREREEKVQAVAEAYGKVPAEEYERMHSEAAAIEDFGDKEEHHTLREDYELGIFKADGEFYVRYSGKCTVCSFSHTFKHDEKLDFSS